MTYFGRPHGVWLTAVCLLAILISAAAVRIAVAEDGTGRATAAQQSSDDPAAATDGSLPAQPPPVKKPGFLNEFGDWWRQSFGDFHGKMDAARERFDEFHSKQHENAKNAVDATADAVKNAAGAAKNAATAVVRLPGTRVLDLHERCEAAPNGAPDCQAAATNACHKEGFNSGQPIDIVTSQQCPAAVMLSGRVPAEGECPDETSVLRAVCQ